MKNFTTFNRLRLNAMLRDFGLDKPLDKHDLALQLLSIELRLEHNEADIAALKDMLQGHGMYLEDCNFERGASHGLRY
jgi:predicted metal-dependent HD superfamily phosphohydrolase